VQPISENRRARALSFIGDYCARAFISRLLFCCGSPEQTPRASISKYSFLRILRRTHDQLQVPDHKCTSDATGSKTWGLACRDLSNPLGAVRMSYEEIKNCLVSTSQEGTEGFCEVAKWLTDMAVRSKWINQQEPEDGDDKEIVDKEANMEVMDLALAPGPLLNSKAKEVNSKDVVSYSCWQLVNESSWPELARQMMATSAIGDEYKSLCDHLGEVNPRPSTLHPTSYTLYPIPYTIHP